MKLTPEQRFAKLPIGIITEGRVICWKCWWDYPIHLVLLVPVKNAIREDYPDGFTCADCDRNVPYK